VESLQRKEKEIGVKKREIAALVEEQKVLRNRISELQEFLKEKEKRLTEEMLEAKEKILSEACEFIEKQTANLPTRKEATTARQAITKELQTVYKEQRKLQEAKFRAIDPSEFKSGQTVYLPQLGECGEIKKIDRGKGTALITVREMEVTTTLYHLRIPEEEATPRQKTPRVSYTRKENVRLELNLHGMRVDEMLAAVEKHLNDALLADAPYVSLLHGVGTGALRRALHEYLRNHPAVKEYRFGSPEEGGGGVTIVKF
jgi:DNA mismatch repair protein MutS2